MRLKAMLLAAVLLLLPLLCLGEELPDVNDQGERVNRALLVGCDRFVSQTDTAPSSANNVAMMAETLSGGNAGLAALTAVPDGLTSTGELAALILDTFAAADGNDVSIFYISTHGVWQESTGSGGVTLLLSDGQTETGVTARQLRTMFDQIPGRKVLLLDACHAGAMLGKGVNDLLGNVFSGPEYVVVCSSGGAEESWFWSGDIEGERLAGAGYFSGALMRALSEKGGYGADDNRDGSITLTELRRYLLANHGASTVRTYPEDSDFPILTYDAAAFAGSSREAGIGNVSFDSDVLYAEDPTVYFTFNVLTSAQAAYQLVYHRDGRWDFDNAELYYDNDGQLGLWPVAGRELTPGVKERALTLTREDADASGYVLFQILAIDRGMPSVISSRVLCVPPGSGDPQLGVLAPAVFYPEELAELTFNVYHAFPCELAVTIVDGEGNTVRRLTSRQATRPEHMNPSGTSFTWDGRLANGDLAPDGVYFIRVRAYVGQERYEYLSDPIELLSPLG